MIRATTLHSSFPALRERLRALPAWQNEAGFLLVEVLITTLLVAAIAVSLTVAYTDANHLTAEERRHNQASQLAAESQEQLRTDPASLLSALYGKPHTYTRTLGSTTYSITQTVEPLSSGGATGCSASEKSAESGSNVSIESAVTWKTVNRAAPPTLREHGIITPPTGSALEVDVLNGAEPLEAPVANVATKVTFTPTGEGQPPLTLEATTNANGCAVFTGLRTTAAKVEVPEQLNYVTPSGAVKWVAKEVAVAPNITTHEQFVFNEGGQIKAEYTYKGETTYKGEAVTGETFVAFQNKMNLEPNFLVGAAGSPGFEYEGGGEHKYKTLTGWPTHAATTAITAAGTGYGKGDVFPFSATWAVYAGDCKANNVAAEDVASPAPTVSPGLTTTTKVPLSRVLLNVWTGTEKAKGKLDATSGYPVTVTDTACSSEPTPDDASAANLKHKQETTSSGHLAEPFQPFGKAELCVITPVASKKSTSHKSIFKYTLAKANGATLSVWEEEAFEKGKKSLERTKEAENEAGEKVSITEKIEELETSKASCP